MDKLPLRSMGYPLGGLTMDPSKGGLALQEASTQHSLQQLSYDPSFAERAAKYSTFGSTSFTASQRGSAPGGYSAFDTGILRDVLETESHMKSPANVLRSASFSGSQASEDDTKTKSPRSASPSVEALEGASKPTASDGVATSQENSSGSHPPPPQQRKRKGNAAKDNVQPATSTGDANSTEKPTKAPDQTPLKRQRSGTSDDAKPKAERSASENSGDSSPRSLKGATSKPPKEELPKQDYIHVRARRGQATDSHSLAERVRREKISERMKFLQDLVPGCSKVTGKAVMLDEIINYVQSLQRQIEFLSMKLAVVAVSPPSMEQYGYDVLGGKDVLLSRSPETTLLGPDPHIGGFGGDLHSHAQLQQQQQHHHHHPMHHHNMAPSTSHLDLHRDMRGVGGVESGLCDSYLRRSVSVPAMASLASADDHFDPLSQAVNLCNGDLQSVVEMSFIQGRQGLSFGSHLCHGSSMCMTGKLKVEM